MAIRFTCSGCSSEMKIKDELAGTAARCPKCKTKFVVPHPTGPSSASTSGSDFSSKSTSQHSDSDSSDETLVRDPAAGNRRQRPSHEILSDADPADTLQMRAADLPLTAAFNPAETLRLEDSDDEIPNEFRPTGTLPLDDSDDTISTTKSPATTVRLDDVTINKVVEDIAVETLGMDEEDEEPSSLLPQSAASGGNQVGAEATLNVDIGDDLDSPPLMVAHPILAKTSVFVAKEYATQETQSTSLESSSKGSKPSRPASDQVAFDPAKFLMSDRPKTDPEISSSKPPARESSNGDSDHYEVPRRDFERREPERPESDRREPERREEIPRFPLQESDTSEFHDRPTARPFNRPTPATKSSAPRPQPEKIDLATAAKMMKKAIKDNQAEEAHQRELDAKSGFDFAGFFQEFGLKSLGILLGTVLVSAGLYYMANRVFSNSLHLPKMGYVTGVIKLNGKPLSGAVVNFSPNDHELKGTKKERARTSVGVSDDQGNFRMMYMPAERIEGVAVGQCRVWVTHIGANGKSDIPPDWGEYGNVVREVTPGKQAAPLEINLEFKTR